MSQGVSLEGTGIQMTHAIPRFSFRNTVAVIVASAASP
jgi:hypothetical protein